MSNVTVKFNSKLNFGKVTGSVNKASRIGVKSALQQIEAESQKQVPLDTGALQSSIQISMSSDGREGNVSYNTDYAIKQHEDTTLYHPNGRKAKYLEDPCNNASVHSNILSALVAAFKAQF